MSRACCCCVLASRRGGYDDDPYMEMVDRPLDKQYPPPPPPLPARADKDENATLYTSIQGVENRAATYAYRDLKSATNSFDESHIIGQGGQSVVYRGQLRMRGTGAFGTVPVAVKVMDIEVVNQPGMKARKQQMQIRRQFYQEVEIMSKMNHPSICKFYGSSVDGPNWCLVCDLQHGNLYERLGGRDPARGVPILTVGTRIRILQNIAKGLGYLHRQGVIHRDVKSANILLDQNMKPKITDFGVSKINNILESTSKHILTQHVVGTLAYMPPEALGGKISAEMDSYALGVIILELLTGGPPVKEGRRPASIVEYMYNALDNRQGDGPQRHLLPRLDPGLGVDMGTVGGAGAGAPQWPLDVATGVINLASRCLVRISSQRASMDEISKGVYDIQLLMQKQRSR